LQKGQFFVIARLHSPFSSLQATCAAANSIGSSDFFATAMVVLVSCGIVFNDRIFSAGKPIVREEHFLLFRIKYFEAQPRC